MIRVEWRQGKVVLYVLLTCFLFSNDNKSNKQLISLYVLYISSFQNFAIVESTSSKNNTQLGPGACRDWLHTMAWRVVWDLLVPEEESDLLSYSHHPNKSFPIHFPLGILVEDTGLTLAWKGKGLLGQRWLEAGGFN